MRNVFVAAVVAGLIGGCASVGGNGFSGGMDDKTKSAGIGAALGCAGGAVLAKMAGGKALAGCAVGGAIGGLVGFEKARQEEIEAAKATQAAIREKLPTARAGAVVTESVVARDAARGETKPVTALKSFSVDLPLSQKGKPEFEAAMEKIRVLAERYADERGEAVVTLGYAPKDAHKLQIAESEAAAATTSGKGRVVVVTGTDATVEKGFERVTVKATNAGRVDV